MESHTGFDHTEFALTNHWNHQQCKIKRCFSFERLLWRILLMQRCKSVSTGRSDCRRRPEQRLCCRQLSAACRSHGHKLINTSGLPMERSGPSPLRAVVNCLWVSNPSSWRWRRAQRRIAASLVFYRCRCRRRTLAMSESVVVNSGANAPWQVHRFSSALLKAPVVCVCVGGGGGRGGLGGGGRGGGVGGEGEGDGDNWTTPGCTSCSANGGYLKTRHAKGVEEAGEAHPLGKEVIMVVVGGGVDEPKMSRCSTVWC